MTYRHITSFLLVALPNLHRLFEFRPSSRWRSRSTMQQYKMADKYKLPTKIVKLPFTPIFPVVFRSCTQYTTSGCVERTYVLGHIEPDLTDWQPTSLVDKTHFSLSLQVTCTHDALYLYHCTNESCATLGTVCVDELLGYWHEGLMGWWLKDISEVVIVVK